MTALESKVAKKTPFARRMLLALLVGLLCTLSYGLAPARAADTHTVTVTVDEYAGSFDAVQVDDGDCVNLNPTELLDENDEWPLESLAEQKKSEHYELAFVNAETGENFDWYDTPVTGDVNVRGVWKQMEGYTATVVYDDDAETEKTAVIPFGKSWKEAVGSVPGTPVKQGYRFTGWANADTEEAFDFNAEITQNTVVTALYDLDDIDDVPYDATEEPPETIESTCHVSRAWLGKRTSWGSHAYFNVSSFKGYLKGMSGVGVCVDPGSDSYNHGTYTYKATRTSWNQETGKVSYEVLISPSKNPCTGKLYTKNKKGYQRAILKVTLTKQPYAHIQLQKSSSNATISSTCDYYDLAGATYEVRNSKGNVVDTLVTDSQGNTKASKKLELGTYTYQETKAAKGYELDKSTHTIKLTGADASKGTALSKCTDVPYTPLRIKKQSSDPALVEGNQCYNLEGATYEVSNEAGTVVSTLVTDSSGNTPLSTPLPEGSYRIREVKQATGYQLDGSTYSLKVSNSEANKDGVVVFECSDVPATDIAELLLDKVDRETLKRLPLAAAKLEGALFEVRYYAGYFDTPEDAQEASTEVLTRNWTMRTDGTAEILFDDEHLYEGDQLFRDVNGNIVLPLGTYVIKEALAPLGYNINSSSFIRYVKQKTDTTATDTFEELTGPNSVDEQVKRGDLRFVKCDEASQARMAKVPFLIMSRTTGEWHLAVTDENGLWASSSAYNPHTAQTNANDQCASGIKVSQNSEIGWEASCDKATIDESLFRNDASCWFGQDAEGTRAQANDSLGALPYDTYLVQELRSSTNEDKKLISFDVTITRDEYEMDLGTLTNSDKQSYLLTTAHDTEDGNKQISSDKSASITDVIEYHGLTANEEYRVETWLVDKSTSGVLAKSEGSFSPKEDDGETSVDIEFDATKLDESTELVVFEMLYRASDGKLIAKHADLNDVGQTVYFSKPNSPSSKHKKTLKDIAHSLPKTMDKLKIAALVLAAATLLGATAIYLVARKRRSKALPNYREQARKRALSLDTQGQTQTQSWDDSTWEDSSRW